MIDRRIYNADTFEKYCDLTKGSIHEDILNYSLIMF